MSEEANPCELSCILALCNLQIPVTQIGVTFAVRWTLETSDLKLKDLQVLVWLDKAVRVKLFMSL